VFVNHTGANLATMLLADEMTLADGWSRQAKQLATAHTAAAVGVIFAQQAARTRPSRTALAWNAAGHQQFAQADGNDRYRIAASQPDDYRGDSNNHPTIATVAARLSGSSSELVCTHNDPIRRIEPTIVTNEALAALGLDPDDAGEEIACRCNEIRSLEESLELALSQNQDFSARLATREAEVSELKLELEQFKAAVTAIAGERDALKRAIDQAAVDKRAAFSDVCADLDRTTAALAEAATERAMAASTLKNVNKRRTIELNAFTSQLSAVYSRAVAAEHRLEETQQKLRMRTEETDQIIRDNQQIARRVAESDASRESLRAQLKRAKSALLSAEKRSATVSAQLAEINDEHKNDINALKMRLASVSSRAAAAESKLLQARQTLSGNFTRRQLKANQINQPAQAALPPNADSRDKAFANAGTNIDWLVEKVTKSSTEVTEILPSQPTAALLTATITF
jgi:chromosome segregation ATPase